MSDDEIPSMEDLSDDQRNSVNKMVARALEFDSSLWELTDKYEDLSAQVISAILIHLMVVISLGCSPTVKKGKDFIKQEVEKAVRDWMEKNG